MSRGEAPTPAIGGSSGVASLRGTGLRMKASKVCSTRLPKILSGSRPGSWNCTMYMCSPKRLRNSSIGSAGARLVVRRVNPDDAGDAVDMPQRHLPDDKAAPVVADENRLVDLEMIEQADEIAGQVLHIVGLDRLRPVGRAITALIRRDHPDSGLASALIW